MIPRPSLWFLRASLIYLAAGFTLGALMLAAKGGPALAPVLRWRPAHQEILIVGWFLNLAMGTAYWILPRIRGSRGATAPVWVAFVALNAGVAMVTLQSLAPHPEWLAVTGRLAEGSAGALFALNAWPRVRGLPHG